MLTWATAATLAQSSERPHIMTEQNPEENPYSAGAGDNSGQTPPPPPPPGFGAAPTPPPPGPGGPGYAAPQPGAPFGIDPISGLPYSDKTKLIAGLLQILIPIGIGRMYMGHVSIGVAQLVVTILTCGLGYIWSLIDGILILVGQPKDEKGLPLR